MEQRADHGQEPSDVQVALQALLVDADDVDYTDERLHQALLNGLGANERRLRISSAWALTLLSGEWPAVIPDLVSGLADRLGGDCDRDVRQVLAQVETQHPERVRAALADCGVEPGVIPASDVDGALPAGPADAVADLDDIRQLVDAGGTDSESRGATDPDHGDTTGETTGASAAAAKRREIERIERSDTFSRIRQRSRFDHLTVVEPRDGGRYADALRARAVDGDEERGVALALLDLPEEGRERFCAAVTDRLARWHTASDVDGVVTIHDWGPDPRPWVATDPIEGSLAGLDQPATSYALQCALDLVATTASLHRRGVVHAGIDPGNVVFPGDALAERPRPLLDNVGLMTVVRRHFSPSDYLDPRYAAPEYFDADYGPVDTATDIYQLGTVLYRLCTGQPPFQGSYRQVRAGVLGADPTPPTDLDPALPEPLDDVIAKATAKQKLVRYETTSQFLTDLRSVCERSGVDVDR
jgi:hypothetical protein